MDSFSQFIHKRLGVIAVLTWATSDVDPNSTFSFFYQDITFEWMFALSAIPATEQQS